MLRRAGPAAPLVVVLAFALGGGQARADGFSGAVEPGFTHTETDATDPTGRTTHSDTDLLTQRYRLSLDRSLTDYLGASVGGTLLDQRGWGETDGVSSNTHGQSTTLFGRLTLGTPVLSAGLGVDRREQFVLGSSTAHFVTESYTADASWRPLDLPELELRLSHVNAYDTAHRVQDTTTDSAAFSTRYHARRYDVRYLLGWGRSNDHLNGVETTGIDQTVLATRTDSLFGGRTSTYVSGTVQSRSTTTISGGQGGTVTRQQLPVAGLSSVVALPATPQNVVLSPNPPLVDGNTAVSATLNVGFGPTSLGDRNPRDMAGRFADVVTAVNTIYVWFDRAVTPEVARALAASVQAYRSDDNQSWSAITLPAGAAVPSQSENRIEITLPQTAARFLAVTLDPLPTTVTTDVGFRDLFVTEVQFLLVLPASLVPRHQDNVLVSMTGLARTLILRSPDLTHDVSVAVAHQTSPSLTTYTVENGVSVRHTLMTGLSANARAARQDVNAGTGHEGRFQWTAALIGTPLPAAYWTITYSGYATDRDEIANSVSALGRADWYEGISSQASASASIITQGLRTAESGQVSGTTSLTPNRFVTVSGGALYSRSVLIDQENGNVLTQFARVDGSVSLTPAPALSAAGTVSRVLIGPRLTTLATVQLNYFPLRGDVQLSVAYSRTLDTEAQATTELLTPALRWNVRPGVSLTTTYTLLQSDAPTQQLTSRVFSANLLVIL